MPRRNVTAKIAIKKKLDWTISGDKASNGFSDHMRGFGETEIIPRELTAKRIIPNQHAHQSSEVISDRTLLFEIRDALTTATS
jgi:hypothetical protein